MFKLSANLGFLFTNLPFLDRIAATAKAGLQGVEFPYQADIAPEDIARAAKSAGLEIPQFNAPAGDQTPGVRGLCVVPEAREKEFEESVATAVKAAGIFGSKLIHLMAGYPEGKESGAVLEERMARRVRFAAEAFAKQGLTAVLEPINSFNMPGYFLCDMHQGLRIMDKVGMDNVKLQYDIFHAQRIQGELVQFMRDHFDRIAHIQIADNPGRHQPGTGEINYPFIFDELRRLNYQGWIGLEYVPEPDTEGSLGWIKAMGVRS